MTRKSFDFATFKIMYSQLKNFLWWKIFSLVLKKYFQTCRNLGIKNVHALAVGRTSLNVYLLDISDLCSLWAEICRGPIMTFVAPMPEQINANNTHWIHPESSYQVPLNNILYYNIICYTSEQSACAASPCENDGTCTANGNADFTCECHASYSGLRCQYRYDIHKSCN